MPQSHRQIAALTHIAVGFLVGSIVTGGVASVLLTLFLMSAQTPNIVVPAPPNVELEAVSAAIHEHIDCYNAVDPNAPDAPQRRMLCNKNYLKDPRRTDYFDDDVVP